MIRSKSGQAGDTVTWIVATIIILFLLVFFIFGASMLGSTRVVKGNFRDSLVSKPSVSEADLFLTKSLITYHSLEDYNLKRSLEISLRDMASKDQFKVNYTSRSKEFLGVFG